jgi:hypothetical protein
MFSIAKKVFGLAGVATVFASMAFGATVPATCTATATSNVIRTEGTSENVAPLVITCSVAPGNDTPAGTANLQVFISPALPVTSKVVKTSTGQTEALAAVSGGGLYTAPPLGGGQYNATVSGSTLNITGIATPALDQQTSSYTITVQNVRVNATSLTVGTGVPPSISATAFISGSAASITTAALSGAQVAYAQSGLGASSVYSGDNLGSNSFVTCKPYNISNGSGYAFSVRIHENFATAFRDKVGEASNVPSTLVTDSTNEVKDGTRIALNFTNVPTGVDLYVPTLELTDNAGGQGTIRVNKSAAGTAFVKMSDTVVFEAVPEGYAKVALTSGAGAVNFEVIKPDYNALDKYDVPVFVVTTANAAAASAGLNVSVAFATIGSTKIPNFVVGANTTTLTGSKFNTCTTSLLFPFVTNQLGFDTGLAISNTSSDPFGTNGATVQAGTCSLNFYGSGAPTPAFVKTPNVPTGTTYTQVLSGVAAGFQGYVIAQCGFQYAHGFAFITNGVGTNGGLSQGYLAGVIPDVNQISRATETGESLGN